MRIQFLARRRIRQRWPIQYLLSCGDEAGAFLIDCGASSLIAMRKYVLILIASTRCLSSHLHGDHFGGLPFLILDILDAQFYSRRTTPLTLVAHLALEIA